MSLRYADFKAGGGVMSAADFTRIVCDPTKGARQSEKDQTDINRIVQRFDREGVLSHLNERVASFQDVSALSGGYREALHQVRAADEFFAQLPAKVRERFSNDPAGFLDALVDPGRRSELEELGVLEKEAGGAPTPPPAPTQ